MDSFVVAPDHDAATAAVGCLPFEPTHVVSHPSGRPWILGNLPFATLSVVHGDGKTLALIGPGDVPEDQMAAALSACASVADLDGFINSLPGVFHVIARVAGRSRVQGTASGLRQVSYAEHAGHIWASDRARTLARLTGAALDRSALALRLLEPVPHPLPERGLWRGIETVPPGHCLVLDGGRDRQVECWWRPPAPSRTLSVGADRVREALSLAVRLHLRGRTRVSSELSGGFDSTALFFLAEREQRVMAVTAAGRDPLDEDAAWAARAVSHARKVDHRVVPAERLPLVYAQLDRATEPLDEPSIAVASRARVLAMTEIPRREGADLHLTGHGGDHLFVGLPTLTTDLLRSRPLLALRHMNAYRGMFGWPWIGMARQLISPGSYRRWLATSATSGTGADPQFPILTWGLGATMPPWLTPSAVEAIHEEVRQAAQTAAPLAATPGRHLELDGIRDGARLARALTDITACAGLPLSTPFFDDRVMEAALAVRIEARARPFAYKPLLAAAMHGIVPPDLLTRETKGVGSMDLAVGLRTYAPHLSRLWSDSRLAELGLVDGQRLARLCARPDSVELDDGALLTTVACELWLRGLEHE
ncbi:asparagine synthase-related protein [Streptomyces sp. NPDC101132]|uniref:asparagine synthase-related protein n=1 Tax=Streptomyces sp. NPDC101132 TaxID=3366110 RepID=UPI00380093CB